LDHFYVIFDEVSNTQVFLFFRAATDNNVRFSPPFLQRILSARKKWVLNQYSLFVFSPIEIVVFLKNNLN
jgi:hypothetical protein